MLKHKNFFFLSLVIPFFILCSCAKVQEEYPIHKHSKEPVVVDEHLVVKGKLNKTEYETSKNEVLSLDGLTIEINGQTVTDRKDKKEDILKGGFFVCAQEDYPTNSIIGSDYKANTNVEKTNFTFYVACALEKEIYVSQAFQVTIKNSKAIKPWVWYTVTGVVVFGVVAMVVFTRRYKAKQEGKH